MGIIECIKSRAKENIKTIVLPESDDKRILEATDFVTKENIAKIILIGNENEIKKLYPNINVEIVDPNTDSRFDELVNSLYDLRKDKGLTLEDAKKLLKENYIYYGCMLVKNGYADGQVCGACHSSSDSLKPALQILKNNNLVSAFFLMDVPNKKEYIYSDCGLIQNPTSEQLALIAKESINTYKLLIQKEPVLVFLSHSTHGTSKCSDVDKVVDAVKIFDSYNIDIRYDGELQLDAAIVPEVSQIKAPNSIVKGEANILIFPDLDAGNIGYKLTQYMGNAKAYGPITQGLEKPMNDLSRGCSVEDIVGVIAITALQTKED